MHVHFLRTAASLSVLACSGILVTSASAGDQTAVAAQLLKQSFACQVPIRHAVEDDTPETVITKQSFSGTGSGFRIIEDSRVMLRHARRAPEELHIHSVTEADYGDIAVADVSDDGVDGRQLHLGCRKSNPECFQIQTSGARGQTGPESRMDKNVYFDLCDEDGLQNAIAAFNVLIRSAE